MSSGKFMTGRALAGRAFWPVLALIVLVAGLVGWAAFAVGPDPGRAWRALLINFIYFTPLAAGMVVWPALLVVARSEWTAPVERPALAGLAFAPISIVAFIALWLGRSHWAAWIDEPNLPNAAWLDETFLFSRDAAALVLLWVLAAVFVRRRVRGRPKALAAWLTFAYAMVFSLLAFDLVMALDPHWFSTLFGGYFFISGMYSAVAAWTVVALLVRPMADVERRHDLGRLIVTFSLLTTYMMFSQLIVIWYEDLPEEVRFVIPRLSHGQPPWPVVSAVLLAVIYLGPLIYLLTRRAKRSPVLLGLVAMAVLAGMWAERWWLVTPTLGGEITWGMTELSITAAFVAAFALAVGWLASRLPMVIPEEVKPT